MGVVVCGGVIREGHSWDGTVHKNCQIITEFLKPELVKNY